MIRKLLATTALATLVSVSAFAQDNSATTAAPADPAATTAPATAAPMQQADGFLVSNLIGENVYSGNAENAEKIGDVNDIVLSKDGKVDGIVVGVGGFLGIGEKDVAMKFEELTWAERNGDRWLVSAATKEQLEAQPAFDRAPYNPLPAPVAANDPAMAPAGSATGTTDTMAATQPADQNAATGADGSAAATTDTMAATQPADQNATTGTDGAASGTMAANQPADATGQNTTDTTTTAAIDKSQLTEIPATDMRAEEIVGTTVYGADDTNVGEIGDVVLTSDGKVDAYIVDVGGFLGMGEKEVAVGADKLNFMADKDGNKYLYTTLSKAQLDAAPAYDKSSWAEQRDSQRITIQ